MSYTDASFAPKRGKAKRALTVVLILIAVVVGSRFLETGSIQVLPSPQVEINTGTATLYRVDSSEPATLIVGATKNLEEGDEIVCSADGTATLTLGDSRTIEMAENTRVTLLSTEWDITDRSNPAWIAVDEGQVIARVAASTLASAPLTLDTDTVSLKTENATFTCSVPDRDHTYVAVFSGEVIVSMGRDEVTVVGGQSLDATLGYQLEVQAMTDAELAAEPTASLTPEASTSSLATTPTAEGVGVTSTANNGTTTYTVQSGDTLYSIAQRYGIDWETLWQANIDTVPTAEQLKAGQELIIPTGGN